MTILDCPRCRRHSLFSTGAFWTCGMCRYAITQTALLVEEAGNSGRENCRQADSQRLARRS
jgi:ribosomal protein L37AE/L43A